MALLEICNFLPGKEPVEFLLKNVAEMTMRGEEISDSF